MASTGGSVCICLTSTYPNVNPAGSRDWQRADKTLRPSGTVALEGGVACETDFADCGEDEECDVEIAGAKVPLQRVSITLPPDVADVAGLTFVLRRWVLWLSVLFDLLMFDVHKR